MSPIPSKFRVALEPLVASARQLDVNARHAWLRELGRESPVVMEAVRAILEGERVNVTHPVTDAPPVRPSLVRDVLTAMRTTLEWAIPGAAPTAPTNPAPAARPLGSREAR